MGPNILLSILFSNTFSLRFSLNVRDQVSHPYKTKGKIRLLYTLTSIFLDSSPQSEAKNEPSQRIGALISRIGGTRNGRRCRNIHRIVIHSLGACLRNVHTLKSHNCADGDRLDICTDLRQQPEANGNFVQ